MGAISITCILPRFHPRPRLSINQVVNLILKEGHMFYVLRKNQCFKKKKL
nr:MAG TPA: hypothetical protein [Caudoviricetes sp.]